MGVRLTSQFPYNTAWPAGYHAVLSHTHTYSGRDDHGGTTLPPRSYQQLAAWTKRMRIAAVGMGSPYTPATAAHYGRFDADPEMVYYQPGFDQLAWTGADQISAMLEEVNGLSEGDTCFYLDNETPKGRYGHLWWINYHLDAPAWHDYDQPYDRWMVDDACSCWDGEVEPTAYERRPYRQIIGSQRSNGALGVWAHPTSWWRGDKDQFITNIATEMPAHAFADGFLDGMVIMGYHAYRPEYLSIWYALLDRGLRVPGVAEMDCGLSDAPLWRKERAYLTLIPGARPSDGRMVAKAWKSGRLAAVCGIWVELMIDGSPMGSAITTSADRHHSINVRLGGECDRYRLQLVGRGGKVVWEEQVLPAGEFKFEMRGLSERGYLLPVVRGLCANGDICPEVCAIGNPVYLHPRGQGYAEPIDTDVTVSLDPISVWRGGRLIIEDADGEYLDRVPLFQSSTTFQAPAGGRITLENGDYRETRYLINSNERVMALQRYLYRGGFTRDFPNAKSGEVPLEAWRLDEIENALATLSIAL